MIQINQNQKIKFLILVVKKTDYNTEITKIQGKIRYISNFVTKTA